MMSKVAIVGIPPLQTNPGGFVIETIVEGELPIDLIQNHYPLGKVLYSVVFSKIPYSYE